MIRTDRYLAKCYRSLATAQNKVEAGIPPLPYQKMARQRKHLFEERKIGDGWARVSAELKYVKERADKKNGMHNPHSESSSIELTSGGSEGTTREGC